MLPWGTGGEGLRAAPSAPSEEPLPLPLLPARPSLEPLPAEVHMEGQQGQQKGFASR